MASGDSDHNYYTLHPHQHGLVPSLQSAIPPTHEDRDDLRFQTSSSPPSKPLQPLNYGRVRLDAPKRPTVSTTYESYAVNSRLADCANGPSVDHHSPDPHDFYRQSPQFFAAEPTGSSAHSDGADTEGAYGMTTSGYQRRTNPSNRGSIPTSKLAPLASRKIPQPSYRSSSAPNGQVPIGNAKSNPALLSSSRLQRPSLKDLVNRFNQQNDELLPVPSRPEFRSASPGSDRRSGSSNEGRAWAPTTSKIPNARKPTKGVTSPPRRTAYSHGQSEKREHRQAGIPSSGRTSRPSNTERSYSEHTASASTSQSLTNLRADSPESSLRPLFGEVIPSLTTTADPGYGIPRHHRRGSEGSMHSPNPMFPHNRSRSDIGTPVSPTAWYFGFSPSVDGSDDHAHCKNSPRSPRKAHRRTRSDISGVPSPASGGPFQAQKASITNHPAMEQSSSPKNSKKRRSSQSRIPLSTRRQSAASDSGASSPSTTVESSNGLRMTRKVTPPKGRSAIPKPISNLTSPTSGLKRPSTPPRIITSRRDDRSPGKKPGNSPSLKAYISAPLPKVSPPLRSSRPRLPVSSASTSASRARVVDRYATKAMDSSASDGRPRKEINPKPKRIPELGAVDFAARRERIQKAFTLGVQEIEKKEREEAMKKEEKDKAAQIPQDPIEGTEEQQSEDQADGVEAETATLAASPIPDVLPAPPEEPALNTVSPPSNVEPPSDANEDSLADDTEFEIEDDDSPTLGVPDSLPTPKGSPKRQLSPERAAIIPAPTLTIDTQGPTVEYELSSKQRTVLSQIMQMRQSSPTSTITQFADDLSSDRDDRESIQIMLGVTPVEQINQLQNLRPDRYQWELDSGRTSSSLEGGHLWGANSSTLPFNEGALNRDQPYLRNDVYADANGANSSAVLDQSSPEESRTSQLLSPNPLATPMTGKWSIDSDAYSSVNRVLEHYHDPDLVSPAMIHSFQQQLFSQSPELARQRGWDTTKIAQLYLQELARGRFDDQGRSPELYDRSDRKDAEQLSPPTVEARENPLEISLDSEPSLETRGSQSHLQQSNSPIDKRGSGGAEDFVDESPSLSGWIQTDPPERSEAEEPEEERPPTPPPKDWAPASNAVVPDQSTRQEPSHDGMQEDSVSIPRFQLPEIEDTGEGLGLAIQVDSPEDSSVMPLPPFPDHSPPPPPFHPPIDEPLSTTERSPPSPSIYSRNPQSTIFPNVSADGFASRPQTQLNGDSSVQQTIQPVPSRVPRTSLSQERISQDRQSRPSTDVSGKDPSPSPEQRRLIKRRHLIKELVDTEYSFNQDMKVIQSIYKETSTAVDVLTTEDVKVLFGNTDEIVAFSEGFLDALKQAASSVYVMAKQHRWRLKRGSVSTANSASTEDQSSMMTADLTDDEKDRKTFLGEIFGQHMASMEKVYGDYLRNHDSANKRLQSLQSQPKVSIWLRECHACHQDITNAWDLDSLLVKPVQRILKYPLLLSQLLEVTPENHPDFTALDVAIREITAASRRINDIKKRADLVEQIVGRKRKESDVRMGFSKAFGRRTEKLRQQVGLSDAVEDREYNALAEKFGPHFIQLQVVMRDVEMYLNDVQDHIDRFNQYASAIEGFIDVGQSNHPELESKWRRFAMSMRAISMTALSEHKSAVRKSVIEPMATLLRLHDGPQRIMQKRNKRIIDYARYKSVKERSDKPDKKTQEHAEQFIALNDTLKDELPRLYSLTGKLVEACLNSFVELQAQWQSVWQEKIKSTIEENQLPKHISDIIDQFSGDFAFFQAQITTLGICNGSLLADAASFLTPSTTAVNDDSSSLRRPSTLDSSRNRAMSSDDVSPSLPTPDFGKRNSGNFSFSPLGETLPGLPSGPQQPNQPSAIGRVRAGSNTSNRGSSTPPLPGIRSFSASTPSTGYQPRPSTSSQSNNSSVAFPRLSTSSATAARPPSGSTYYTTAHEIPPQSSSPNVRFSGIFSSALPMSEHSPSTSRAASPPVHDGPHDYNVLFLVASCYEFNIDRARREAGYPYLTYVPGEIFDVIGEKGELWLAKNQDDPTNTLGWIWNKHFAKLADS
ncbi:MAG: hypothetical protein M1819_004389 [Sarea resinae]|nr:MAG: hypothetical protein M1819_004389 [Sarea resinae]